MFIGARKFFCGPRVASLGADIRLETLARSEIINHHGVTLSLLPAGHMLGSAQVRLELEALASAKCR